MEITSMCFTEKPRQREIRDNQTYPSPYLEPLVLKFKERPEYIYKNRHKEYYWMKSYFDYRDEMVIEKNSIRFFLDHPFSVTKVKS